MKGNNIKMNFFVKFEQMFKVNGSIILEIIMLTLFGVSYKKRSNENKQSRDIVCIFEIIYVRVIYDYIAGNKVLLNIIIHHINVVTKLPRTLISGRNY